MYCPNCKTHFDEGNFCLKCGTKLVENPTIGFSIGDCNVFNGSITYDASHHVQNTNNITQVAAQKTEMELVQEKKAKYLEACRKAYEDNVLDQNEANRLERYRVELGLSRDDADKMLNVAAQERQQGSQRQELTSIARIKLKQFSDALKANDIATLQCHLDSIEALANKFINEELQFTYHLALATLKQDDCIKKYESTRADNYWQMYWTCLAYCKRGNKYKSEAIQLSLEEKFPNYPADNLALLAVACACLGGDTQEAKEYLQELTGGHSPLLNGLAECVYLMLEPDTGTIEQGCLFYFTKVFEQETTEEKARRKADEEAKARTEYEVIDGIGYIPYGVTSIREEAFRYNKDLVEINIPEGVTCIKESAFYACSSLTSIVLPESLTEIGRDAFYDCSSLTSIRIHPLVTNIGCLAFKGCSSLTSISIPPSVTKIEGSAFSGCSSLTSIKVDYSNPIYDSRENCNAIIHTESNILICGCQNSVIPPSVTEIGNYAFSGCSSLTSISIPPSVTKIEDSAFLVNSSLTSIKVDYSNPVYDSRENCNAIIHTKSNTLVRGCVNTIIPPSVTKIGSSAFSGCSSLTSISIPPSVKEISSWAFMDCSSLTSICIPPSVTEIRGFAFDRCSSLTTIFIPPSVTEIGNCAFWGCSSLTIVKISKNTKISSSAINKCPQVKIERY